MKQLISSEYTRQIKRKRQINVNSEVGGLETQKANHYVSDWLLYDYVVGAVGFEPTASCSQGRRANQAALRPDYIEKGPMYFNRA